jgi:hypothetical protein
VAWSTQWRRLPKRSATAGQRTAATTEDETAAAPDVGLGAGASAAIATPARADAASAAAATATARKALDAISLRYSLQACTVCTVEREMPRRDLGFWVVLVQWCLDRDERRLLFIADERQSLEAEPPCSQTGCPGVPCLPAWCLPPRQLTIDGWLAGAVPASLAYSCMSSVHRRDDDMRAPCIRSA